MNGGPSVLVDQPDSGGGGVVISVPVKLTLNGGANALTFGAGQSSASLPPLCFFSVCGGVRVPWPQARAARLTITLPLKRACSADYAADLDKIVVY